MSPDELSQSTMDPEHRVLKQITMADLTKANNAFNVLMGESAALRKDFIEKNAERAFLAI